jgi:hypothetical protein
MTLGSAGRAEAVGETVNVSPDTNLPSPANVNVSGSGFTANSSISIYQCAEKNGVDSCTNPLSPNVPTNASGSFGTTAVTVAKSFVNEFGETIQCKTKCRIVVWDNIGPHMGEHSIKFPK